MNICGRGTVSKNLPNCVCIDGSSSEFTHQNSRVKKNQEAKRNKFDFRNYVKGEQLARTHQTMFALM